MFRIAVVSMPWPLFNRPSLQLGTLKSYLKSCDHGLDISTYPAYLEVAAQIGFGLYHNISKHSWIAEAVYASVCTTTRSLEQIKDRLAAHSLESLQNFFCDLVQKRIMLKEKDRYLSLAIKEGDFQR